MQNYNYLNLDLIYNINKYLFPLFYYKNHLNGYQVYSPMALKSISLSSNRIAFLDLKTKYFEKEGYILRIFIQRHFTLEKAYYGYSRINPINLSKDQLSFLCSNRRIIKILF